MDSAAHIVACLRITATDLDLPERSELALKNVIGLGFKEALHALFPDHKHRVTEFIDRYRYYYLDSDQEPSTLFDGANALLNTLLIHQYHLAIATGKGRAGLNQVLKEQNLQDTFHVTRCADETTSKPDPHMLLEIMDVTDMTPHDTLMIGDTEYDLHMAQNAGCDAIAITHGVHDKARLLACEPKLHFDDLHALHTWFMSGN